MKTNKILSIILLLTLLSCDSKSVSDLITNYKENKVAIQEFNEYFNSLIPPNCSVRIRYNADDNIDFFVSEKNKDTGEWESLFGQWNIDFENYKETAKTDYEYEYGGKTKSLELVKSKLNWTTETFNTIYRKLENINCMGISAGTNTTEVEFGYQGMGVLSYLIFDDDLNEEEQEKYSDDCMYLFYEKNIVFSYGSGAIGSFCTPSFDRKKIKVS